MKRILTLAATAVLVAASAAAAEPQIPTWANPYPAEPVATDGSPLPVQSFGRGVSAADRPLVGRSVAVGHHPHRHH